MPGDFLRGTAFPVQPRHNAHFPEEELFPGQRAVIIDDLIATGGTVRAAARLVERLGGTVAKAIFLIELPALGGRENLKEYEVESVVQFDGE